MNVIIPMAGLGKRFNTSEYELPKPLINIFGKPMIQLVLENLNINANYTFIVREEHQSEFGIVDLLKKLKPTSNIIPINEITEGPACTALLAEEFIDDSELFIVNCDQIVSDFDVNKLLEFVRIKEADGVLGSFISTSPKNSYMRLSDTGEVIDIKEKVVISNVATNGLHFWKSGNLFLYSTKEMIKNNERYNGEFYIAPSYNYLLKDGKKVLPFFYNLHFPIGIPNDLKKYINLYENF